MVAMGAVMMLSQAGCGSPDSGPMRELVDLPARYFEQASRCQPFQHAERTQHCIQQAEAAYARVPNLPFAQGQVVEGTRQTTAPPCWARV